MRKINLHSWVIFSILLSFLLVSGSELYARTIYVAPNGNDNNSGTIDQPFKSINKAYGLSVAGDLIYVRGGTYTESFGGGWGMFGLNRNGTPGNPITLKAYPGETVVLDAQNRNDNEHKLVFRMRCNYNVIDGFEITRGWEGGISLEQTSNHNQIINCYIHHNGNVGNPGSQYGQDAVYSDVNTHDNLYANNVISYNGRLTANNQLDHGLYICGDNETLENNIITHNESWGIQVAGYTTVTNLKIYNNVLAFNGQGGIVLWMDMSGIEIKNNICYKNDHYGICTVGASGSGVVINNNSFYMNSSGAYTLTPFSIGTANITSNPLFVSETDYHLQAGSSCINAGTVVGLPYLGNAPDLGYKEFSTSSTTVAVNAITVTGANGLNTISTDKGTLQLSSAIAPSNASNKTVTWSIQNGTGQASINSSGVVTAVSNGTATARATANDGSGVYGTLTITISNQAVTTTGTITRSDGCSIITAPSGNPTSEAPSMAFDNLSGTKWYNYSMGGNVWIKYQFCGGASYVINSYSITSANDMPLRDPQTISISGSNDGVNFTLLDTKTNIAFSSRYQKLTFSFTNTKAYQYYRLDMKASPGNDGFQVSEIELIETGAVLKSTAEVTFTEGIVTVAPNPFREALTIDYNLPKDSHVNLVVYDLNGMVVRQLVNEDQFEGAHHIIWDALNSNGSNLHNGIYILKFESAFGSEISKIIYME